MIRKDVESPVFSKRARAAQRLLVRLDEWVAHCAARDVWRVTNIEYTIDTIGTIRT